MEEEEEVDEEGKEEEELDAVGRLWGRLLVNDGFRSRCCDALGERKVERRSIFFDQQRKRSNGNFEKLRRWVKLL